MKEHFSTLINRLWKAKAGILDGAEQDELNEALKDPSLKKILEYWMDDKYVRERLQKYESYPFQPAYRKFIVQVKKNQIRKRCLWIGSSAAIILLMIGIFRWLPSERSLSEDISPVVAEMLPGGNKASILFPDGKRIEMEGDSLDIIDTYGTTITYKSGKISYHNQQTQVEEVHYQIIVPPGGECFITLDDNTKVWLNASSKLRYPLAFTADLRQVYLEGEAYFDVAKGEKPFIVATALGNVNVHGTSFGVRAYQEEEIVMTTLVSGQVSFSHHNKVVSLFPGEQAVSRFSGILEKRPVDVDEYIGWKNGLYIFRERSLESIMKELARWYDVEVIFQDNTLKELTFTGNLKRYESINSFMSVLVRSEEVNYKIDGKMIILY